MRGVLGGRRGVTLGRSSSGEGSGVSGLVAAEPQDAGSGLGGLTVP